MNARQSEIKKFEKRILELENIDFTMELYELAKDNKGYYHADYAHISKLRANEKKYLNEKLFQLRDEIDEFWKRDSSKAEELKGVLEWDEEELGGNKSKECKIAKVVVTAPNVVFKLM